MTRLLVRWLVLALGVTLATKLVPGISCADGLTLFVVVVLLSFFNVILKPVLLLFTLPFIILTMGLGIVLINALLLYWTSSLVKGFHVESFWAAIWGGVVISITNFVINLILRSPPKGPPNGPPMAKVERGAAKRTDVIDI